MISLTSDRSLRIRATGHACIACETGLVWVTAAGDPRDVFLRRGESIELGPGLIIATALQDAVVHVAERRLPPWIERLAGRVKTGSELRPMRIQWLAMCRPRVQELHAPPVPIKVCDATRPDPSAALGAEQPLGPRPGSAHFVAAGGGAGGSR